MSGSSASSSAEQSASSPASSPSTIGPVCRRPLPCLPRHLPRRRQPRRSPRKTTQGPSRVTTAPIADASSLPSTHYGAAIGCVGLAGLRLRLLDLASAHQPLGRLPPRHSRLAHPRRWPLAPPQTPWPQTCSYLKFLSEKGSRITSKESPGVPTRSHPQQNLPQHHSGTIRISERNTW